MPPAFVFGDVDTVSDNSDSEDDKKISTTTVMTTTIKAVTPQRQSWSHADLQPKHKDVLLPQDFEPTPRSVVVGRSKECKSAEGNQRLRTIVAKFMPEYSNAKNKAVKTEIVTTVVAKVKAECAVGAFVKRSTKYGRWYEVTEAGTSNHSIGRLFSLCWRTKSLPWPHFELTHRRIFPPTPLSVAREKVGYVFRDLLHSKYRSSSASKAARRRQELKLEQERVEREVKAKRKQQKLYQKLMSLQCNPLGRLQQSMMPSSSSTSSSSSSSCDPTSSFGTTTNSNSLMNTFEDVEWCPSMMKHPSHQFSSQMMMMQPRMHPMANMQFPRTMHSMNMQFPLLQNHHQQQQLQFPMFQSQMNCFTNTYQQQAPIMNLTNNMNTSFGFGENQPQQQDLMVEPFTPPRLHQDPPPSSQDRWPQALDRVLGVDVEDAETAIF